MRQDKKLFVEVLEQVLLRAEELIAAYEETEQLQEDMNEEEKAVDVVNLEEITIPKEAKRMVVTFIK